MKKAAELRSSFSKASIRPRLRGQVSALTAIILLVASCGITDIDHFFTFVVAQSTSYVVPASAPVATDLVLQSMVKIDTSVYSAQHTRNDLLGTSYVTHLFLSTSSVSFKLQDISHAVFVIGADTIADQAVSKIAVDTLSLDVRNVDITKYLKDTAYVSKLILRLGKSPTQPVQLGLTITISQTATPIAD